MSNEKKTYDVHPHNMEPGWVRNIQEAARLDRLGRLGKIARLAMTLGSEIRVVGLSKTGRGLLTHQDVVQLEALLASCRAVYSREDLDY